MPTVLPTSESLSIIRGDSAKWTRYVSDYLAPDWVLTYSFVRQGFATVQHVATDAGNGKHQLALTPAQTAALDVGAWYWGATVTDSTDRYTIGRGSVVLEPDYATDTGFDPRSFAQRMVDILRARLEKRAASDVVAQSAEGFSLSVMSDGDARAQLQYWERRLQVEQDAENARLGNKRAKRRTLYVTMR